MNRYTTTGRLVDEPVYKDLPGEGDKHVVEMRIAVDGAGRGRDDAGYFDVHSYTMSKRGAETIGKGWLVGIDGRLQHETWEAQDGSKRSAVRIVANNVQFLAAPRGGGAEDTPDAE